MAYVGLVITYHRALCLLVTKCCVSKNEYFGVFTRISDLEVATTFFLDICPTAVGLRTHATTSHVEICSILCIPFAWCIGYPCMK